MANAVIHRSTSDYFGPDAEFNPLLHTWSLSVEEQFYLVFPGLLALSFLVAQRLPSRWAKSLPLGVTSALALLSLVAIRGIPGVPPGSFLVGYYSSLTPFRSAQLTSGRAIAKHVGQVVGVPLLVLGLCLGGMTLTRGALVGSAYPPGPEPGDHSVQALSEPCAWASLQEMFARNGACNQKNAGASPEIVILGDSHADRLVAGAVDALPHANVGLVAFISPRLFNGPSGAGEVAKVIGSDPGVKVVIIGRMLDRSDDGILPHDRVALPALAGQLAQAGKQVFVLDDVPNWPSDIFTCAYRHALVMPGRVCEADRSFFEPRHALISEQLDEILSPLANVHALRSFWSFCDATTCHRALDQQLLYSDEHHLTDAGSRLLWDSLISTSPELRTATSGYR